MINYTKNAFILIFGSMISIFTYLTICTNDKECSNPRLLWNNAQCLWPLRIIIGSTMLGTIAGYMTYVTMIECKEEINLNRKSTNRLTIENYLRSNYRTINQNNISQLNEATINSINSEDNSNNTITLNNHSANLV